MRKKDGNYDIFISYEETTGLEFAEHLKQALERRNISAFVARRDIPIGRILEEVINNALTTCNKFIAILTPNVSVSAYVRQEIELALTREQRGELEIIPCKYEELKEEDIPTEIRDLNMIIFTSKQDLATKVLSRIRMGPTPPIRREKILEDAEKAGIKRIFTNRRNDPGFEEEIRQQIPNSREVLMMANSLRDFFGDVKNARYSDVILKAQEAGTEFKLLLLNPLSEAAKDRAIIENGPIVADDEIYVKSPLFRDIRRVANWLHAKSDERTEIRFSSLTPTVFMIRTDRYTFIEQYHIGSLKDAEIRIAKEDEHAYCLGGYVPVLMVDNSSSFAKLMRSHFDNAWDKAEEFRTVFDEINEFSKNGNQRNYRRKQFISFIQKKADDLLRGRN